MNYFLKPIAFIAQTLINWCISIYAGLVLAEKIAPEHWYTVTILDGKTYLPPEQYDVINQFFIAFAALFVNFILNFSIKKIKTLLSKNNDNILEKP